MWPQREDAYALIVYHWSLHAMDCTLSDVKCVGIDGLKSRWLIFPEDQIIIDAEIFVRMRTNVVGLQNLIIESNDAITDKPKEFTLNCLNGYRSLMQLRNAASGIQHVDPDPEPCTVFAQDTPSKKKSRKSHEAKQVERQQVSSCAIELEVDGTTCEAIVARASHPRDALFVSYSKSTMDAVLKYMRTSGVSMEHKQKHKSVAIGIYENGDKFMAVATNDGKKRHRITNTLEEALVWQQQQVRAMPDAIMGEDDVSEAQM